MKRKISLFIITAVLLSLFCGTSVLFAHAADDTCTLQIDGKKITTDVPPRFENERVLVPVRALTEAMNGTVEWHQPTETATLTYNGITMTLKIGSKTAVVNDQSKTMDIPARIFTVNKIDRTMVPVRFVAENFGLKVDWDEGNRIVKITTTGSGTSDQSPSETTPSDTTPSGTTPSDTQAAGKINSVTLTQGSSDETHSQITITSDTALSETMYTTGTLTDPNRYYLDFTGFQLADGQPSTITDNSNTSAVNEVRTGKTDTGVRVTIDMAASKTPTVQLSADKKTMTLSLPRVFDPWADGKLVVCLDPGHGSDTGGKRSPDGTLREYEFNRAVANKIKTHLVKHGIEVVMTVPDDDLKDISLEERCKIANASDADIFVSIHANAYTDGWTSPKGWEIYTYQKGTVAERLAKAIEATTIPDSGLTNRGLKTANFYVIKNTKMPAVLIEHGFYTNTSEVELLKSDSFRERLAVYDAKGICNFLGVQWLG